MVTISTYLAAAAPLGAVAVMPIAVVAALVVATIAVRWL